MLESKRCLEAAKKAEELKTMLSNIVYKLESSPTIKMVYEDGKELLTEDIEDFNNKILMLDKIIESLEGIDSVIVEDEERPLSREDIESLRKEGRL